jgi:single-strand DNA-binding protein
MPNLNKVIIMGYLGKTPEIINSGNNKIANLSVATTERWKDKNGDIHQLTEWHKVIFFNKLAGIAEVYLTKGDGVYIEGKLRTEKYVAKDGIERYSTKIIGSSLQMLNGKSKDEASKQKVNNNTTSEDEKFDDDIPF